MQGAFYGFLTWLFVNFFLVNIPNAEAIERLPGTMIVVGCMYAVLKSYWKYGVGVE
jgi:hypothetical protein